MNNIKVTQMKKTFFLLIIILAFTTGTYGQSQLSVTDLRTEYLRNPIGIDVRTPHFSWQMNSSERGAKQTAYEITVSTDKNASNTVWSSGRIESGKSVNNTYAGASLAPSTRYYWHVDIWDNNNTRVSSTETAYFETGLLESGWGAAKWIKATTLKKGESNNEDLDPSTVTDYTISMDFQINDVAAGPCFGAKNAGNFFMWQINIETGRVRFRPHSWLNGGGACHENKDITSLINIQRGVTYSLRIEIKGDKASTYINDILIDADRVNPRGGNYGYGDMGFRSSKAENSSTIESAYFDNIKVTTNDLGVNKTLFEENFSIPEAFAFTLGSVNEGRLLVNVNAISWQKAVADASTAKFTLEMDLTLLVDNAGIIFAAKDANNMYMWSINTHDQSYPLIRRHIYSGGTPTYSDNSIGALFTKADLIGKEKHVKIEVENSIIKTYIDGVLVDTFNDTSGTLKNGYVGFRAYNGNNTDEVALFDNIVLTDYQPNETTGILEPIVVFSEDFENNKNAFEGIDAVNVNGNFKLKMFAKGSDLRVLQGVSNGVPMFRTEFEVAKTVASAKIYTSALGVYDLFINGNRVGTTQEDGTVVYDELKPGWTDYNKTAHYFTYDVTNIIQSGDNAIGAHVASGWWKGAVAHGKYGDPELSFIAKLIIQYTDGSIETIVTNPDWMTSSDGPIRMADIYNGETYDARKENDWRKAGFDDSEWYQTAIFNGFKGTLKAFVGPSIQVRSVLTIEPLTATVYNGSKSNGQTHGAINTINTVTGSGLVNLRVGETVVYDLGQNMVGWVKFTAKSDSGTKMKIRFGEMLNDNGASSRGNDGPAGSLYTANLRGARATLSYTFKGSETGETFNPDLTFFGFRYCEITATHDVEIQTLVGEIVGSATEEGSTFTTSSSIVNKLYNNVMWGQRSNFLSVPTDCPQRDERLGWTGDTQIFARAASYNADVASFFHKWMGDMRDSQRSDGAYPDVAPHAWVGYGQGAWAEAGIIVPWTVYLMYDDTSIISENYESMEKYMNFLAAQGGGGYLYNGAGTNYGDWVAYESMDSRYISVCYYAYAAQLMAKMSKVLSTVTGDGYDLKRLKYETLYNNIKAEFQTRYVNSNGTLKQVSQTAYLLALKLDLFPNVTAKNNGINFLTQKIANNGNRLSTGFVGTGILNQTLSQFGATNTAYNLLLQRNNPSWLYSVDQGATTIWERWDSYTIERGFQDVGMNSFNHYAYGAVSEWMFRYMAGIEASESTPGFKHFVLQPDLDKRATLPQGQERITSVEASYRSYYGDIQSAWRMRDDGNLLYTATVPANTTATLYLPLVSMSDVVYEGSTLAENADGVTFVKKENGKAIYELESGTYVFGLNISAISANYQIVAQRAFPIFPNPVCTKLTIAKEPTDYLISNLVGKPVKQGFSSDVDVADLGSGVYFVHVDNRILKFIKK
jgi:alpha-L-rhamnosidase